MSVNVGEANLKHTQKERSLIAKRGARCGTLRTFDEGFHNCYFSGSLADAFNVSRNELSASTTSE